MGMRRLRRIAALFLVSDKTISFTQLDKYDYFMCVVICGFGYNCFGSMTQCIMSDIWIGNIMRISWTELS